ncbi:aminoacetone oxidase family FAD-binding enzyme [Hyphomicrobium methylovorum]|uniref:TIGR03862 family flavoprotein n=1 Tax=Hyphomicrobium methylovorum TaxID=84 RepID=UPI0015E6A7B6|nr:TIGR03862 family flavoprotein [Hyphomicrobium methylovorum]MBA2124745.1 aminoacetone oxidase family FAD-binding enzyme [Hyphomicrobium methylovorum]
MQIDDGEHNVSAPTIAAREIAIIGAGPAGLFAAETIAAKGHRVTIYERMPSPARKFLLAGRGGLNLTHSEDLSAFLARYGTEADRIRAAVTDFPAAELIQWADGLGAETFVGSSGRIFPKSMKASPLLRAWLRRLDGLGVTIRTRHRWVGFGENGALVFETPDDAALRVTPAATLLALGGASWPRLGSNGQWTKILDNAGVGLTPLSPANCGVTVAWSAIFRDRFEGSALKRVALSVGEDRARGEAIVTRGGLEGGVVYALGPAIRERLTRDGFAEAAIDLKPDMTAAEIQSRLSKPRGKTSMTNFLRKAVALDPVAIGLLRESRLPLGPDALAHHIKATTVRVTGLAGMDRAISTAGGIAWRSVDDRLMLTSRPGVFVAGEMLDWEAPTGGYLLQGTFATAAKSARGLLDWLSTH